MQRNGKLGAATMVVALALTLAACPAREEEPVVELEEAPPGEEPAAAFEEEDAQDEDAAPAVPADAAPVAPIPPEAAPPPAPRPEPPPPAAPPAEEPPPPRPEPAPPPPPPAPAPPAPPPAAPPPPVADAAGRQVFLGQNCQRCHSVSTAGIEARITTGRTAGGDLSASTLDRDSLRAVALREREVDGRRHLGEFTGTAEELQVLVDWLMAQRP